MAKTCRTCRQLWTIRRCVRFNFRKVASYESCDFQQERETPLLVDELAEVVAGMMDAMTGSWYVYRKIPGTQEVDTEIVRKAGVLITRAYVLLARHKEEVGDGKDVQNV